MQEDLNELYTGYQISSHYVYAQNFTYLWVVMMYSTGMPLLYPFAAVFYGVLYWVYKFLLLKFYQRTNKFNEELPIFSTNFIKFGLVLHGIFGGLMLTNSSLIPVTEKQEDKQGNALKAFRSRFEDSVYAELYLAFWIIVIIWLFLKETVLSFIWGILKRCFSCCDSEVKEKDAAHSKDFLMEIKVGPLIDIYDKAKDELMDLDTNFNPENQENYRFEEEI